MKSANNMDLKKLYDKDSYDKFYEVFEYNSTGEMEEYITRLIYKYDELCIEEYQLHCKLREHSNPEVASVSEKWLGQRGLDLIKLGLFKINKKHKWNQC